MDDVVTTRDRSSGRYHVRYQLGRRLLVDERCNLDQAGSYEVMPRGTQADRGDGVLVGAEPSLLCQYCFERPEAEEVSKDRV